MFLQYEKQYSSLVRDIQRIIAQHLRVWRLIGGDKLVDETSVLEEINQIFMEKRNVMRQIHEMEAISCDNYGVKLIKMFFIKELQNKKVSGSYADVSRMRARQPVQYEEYPLLFQDRNFFRHLFADSCTIIEVDACNYNIVSVNKNFEKLFGYPREELINRPMSALMIEEMAPHHDRIMADTIERGITFKKNRQVVTMAKGRENRLKEVSIYYKFNVERGQMVCRSLVHPVSEGQSVVVTDSLGFIYGCDSELLGLSSQLLREKKMNIGMFNLDLLDFQAVSMRSFVLGRPAEVGDNN